MVGPGLHGLHDHPAGHDHAAAPVAGHGDGHCHAHPHGPHADAGEEGQDGGGGSSGGQSEHEPHDPDGCAVCQVLGLAQAAPAPVRAEGLTRAAVPRDRIGSVRPVDGFAASVRARGPPRG